MWLAQNNLMVKVSRATEAEVEWLRSKASGLTYGNKKTLWTTGEVQQVRFFDLLDSTFPAGFLKLVRDRAAAAGVRLEMIDNRSPRALPQPADLGWLRDYQVAAVEAALTATRGIIKASTGAGKTEMAVGLVKRVPDAKWLFLVHRKTLMEQAAQRYELRSPGERAGRMGDGVFDASQRFTVATFQTLASLVKTRPEDAKALLAQFDGLIVDEAHVLPAESFWRITMSLPNAYYRVGISGTPLDREDQRSVFAVAALGPVVFEIGAQQLIAEGRLARPLIRMVTVEQEFSELDARGLFQRWDWQKVYEEGVVRSKLRNRALLGAVAAAEKPCLVFVKDLAHGEAFTNALCKRGTRVEFIWGAASLAKRQAAVRRLERGDLDCVVCSVIFQEGVDIPELRSVVIASGGKSVIAALQRIGRGMRTAEGKDTFEVWDVNDTGNAWLTRHSRARRNAYLREGYQVSVVAPSGHAPQGALL
jgi:superfamily II DNA or RNA helicase